jgi:plastocyanin
MQVQAHERPQARGPRTGALLPAALFAAMSIGLSQAQAATSHTIEIEGVKFAPATLEVKVGDTVVWKNKDPFPHNATAANNAFHSPDIQGGKSWSFKAAKKGVFPYICTLHPNMKATLVVK